MFQSGSLTFGNQYCKLHYVNLSEDLGREDQGLSSSRLPTQSQGFFFASGAERLMVSPGGERLLAFCLSQGVMENSFGSLHKRRIEWESKAESTKGMIYNF